MRRDLRGHARDDSQALINVSWLIDLPYKAFALMDSSTESVDLRQLLDTAVASSGPRVEKLAVAAAVISEILRRRGMEATLVGGGGH